MVVHSAARTFIYWFLRLWMFTSTDAASRVCTRRARILISTPFVFREQLLIFVFPANVTFALSLFACAGILPESLLAARFQAIPEGAESAATILLYWSL